MNLKLFVGSLALVNIRFEVANLNRITEDVHLNLLVICRFGAVKKTILEEQRDLLDCS